MAHLAFFHQIIYKLIFARFGQQFGFACADPDSENVCFLPLWITFFFFLSTTATSVYWVWQLSSAAFEILFVEPFGVSQCVVSVCARVEERFRLKCIDTVSMCVSECVCCMIKLWVRLRRTPTWIFVICSLLHTVVNYKRIHTIAGMERLKETDSKNIHWMEHDKW